MFFRKVPALKRLCIIKIATSLWNINNLEELELDVRAVLRDIHFINDYYSEKVLGEVEVGILRKLSELSLPEKSRKEISDYIKPIGEELLAWLYQNHFQFKCNPILPKVIFWTNEGSIDKVKTGKVLVADERLSVLERYKLACTYRLEDFIYVLWSQLDDNQKIQANNDYAIFFSSLKKVNEIYTTAFRYSIVFDFEKSAMSGNLTACKYFMEKLTEEEKTRSLLEIARHVLERSSQVMHRIVKKPYHDLLRFLFLQMTQQQRTQLSRHTHIAELWTSFLNGQWQISCPPVSDLLSDFAPNQHAYICLLSGSVSKINEGYRDYNYLELCRKVWDETPSSYRKYMIEEFKKCGKRISFWQSLLETGDETTIEHMLKGVSAEDKREVFAKWKLWFTFWIVEKDKWDFLKFILRMFELPDETLIAWREHCVRFSRGNVGRTNTFVKIINGFVKS